MWNGNTRNKKFTFFVIFIFVIAIFLGGLSLKKDITFAVNSTENNSKAEQEFEDKIDEIMGDIDSGELDDYIQNDFNLNFFESYSVVEIVKSILSGKYFEEYDSLFSGVISYIKSNLKSIFTFVFTIFSIIVAFELFNSFCVDKYSDIKNIVKIIFTIIIAIMIISVTKQISEIIFETVNKVFNFSKILFPILLSLILTSGANGTYSIYTTLSTFLLQTGSYIFIYVLLPIVLSITLLSIVSCVFSKNRFDKLISFLKSIFKYIIIAFFAIFGIFSTINIVTSGISDGVNYKLTKFAIKNYIPVLGGYLSDGFDFLHSCSIMIKNSFGICGILIILLIVLKPILYCFIYSFMLKILSVLVSFIGNNLFADYFERVSVSISYYISILAGVFLCLFVFIYLLIMSVSVV